MRRRRGHHSSDRRTVFVSYAREDGRAAEWISDGLTSSGWDVWVDVADIEGARAWAGEIESAIGAADILVLLHSSHSAASAMVERELSSAAAQATPIVVAELEDAPLTPSASFLLRSRQFVPVSGPGHQASGASPLGRLEEAMVGTLLEERGRRPSGARLLIGRLLTVVGAVLMVGGFVGFAAAAYLESQDPSLGQGFPPEVALAWATMAVGILVSAVGAGLRRSARMRSLR